MPNGDSHNPIYNFMWCREKHTEIDKEFLAIWNRVEKMESKLWGIIILLLVNVGGIIGILIK